MFFYIQLSTVEKRTDWRISARLNASSYKKFEDIVWICIEEYHTHISMDTPYQYDTLTP